MVWSKPKGWSRLALMPAISISSLLVGQNLDYE